LPAVICFPHQGSWSGFLVPRDPSEVSTLSGWVSPRAGYLSWPVALSAPLQGSLRFFRLPLPAAPSPSLAVRIPPLGGAQRAYPVDCCGDALRWGWGLSPGGAFGCCCRSLLPTVRPTLPFWLRPLSLFGRFRL